MHVAIIMDGNGRWAQRRGEPRASGHARGARAVRATIEAAVRAQLDMLTLFAFSSDNWFRPHAEVSALMRLFRRYLRVETARCLERGVRLNVIGRRDRLEPGLLRAIETSERATAGGRRLQLRIAIDYSARYSILAAARYPRATVSEEHFHAALDAVNHAAVPSTSVDLVIRTGEEQRLSDFLLWESAYAELWFTDTMWPDFGERDLNDALESFSGRERRFGKVASG
jgi:undecaprenyl diphosphate synthase